MGAASVEQEGLCSQMDRGTGPGGIPESAPPVAEGLLGFGEPSDARSPPMLLRVKGMLAWHTWVGL